MRSMEIVAATSKFFCLHLYRSRIIRFCVLCLAILSGLCVSGISNSRISNPLRQPDSWSYVLSMRSRASSNMKIQSNNLRLPNISLDASVQNVSLMEERRVSIYLCGFDACHVGKDGEKLGDDVLIKRYGGENDEFAISGEQKQSGTIVPKPTPIQESALIVSSRDNAEVLPFHKNVASQYDGEKLLYLITSTERKEAVSKMSRRIDQCDISVGKWVHDDSYPLYQPGSCPYVDEGFGCQENGRGDSGYMRWRWKPKYCEIPRFNASKLLDRLRGKRLVFAGDSLNRNQWESMLCLLREGLPHKTRMVETRGQRITKRKGAFVFKFLDYDFKVEFYRSHYLVAEGKQPLPGSSRRRLTLRLDTIDRTAKRWRKADYLVFTTGHWWTHGKTAKGRNFFQEGDAVHRSLPVMVAFRKAMTTWGSWIDRNVNPDATKVFFCGYSPAHFNGGQWDSGGQCHKEFDPISNESYIQSYPEKMLVLEDTLRKMKTPVKLLNVTRFSEFRKDAHPSIYGYSQNKGTATRHPEDCSHWCLPGLPDIWNEILYAFMIKSD